MVLANGKEKQLKLLEKLRQLDASGKEFTTGDVASTKRELLTSISMKS